jgi:hypothetical protein
VQLEQSPFLRLLPDEGIKQALHLMNRPAETPLTSEIAREVCERTDSTAVLEGSIASLETGTSCGYARETAAPEPYSRRKQSQAGRKEEVLNALSRIATQIRTRLGESLGTVQEHSTPLLQATTSASRSSEGV